MAREKAEEATIRQAKLATLQEHYISFSRFLQDMMAVLGFQTTWVQHDIGLYMQYGPQYIMVQAQRGEAKTTIAAIYAVFTLIHNPKSRILIVSAGNKMANQISTLITKLILTVDVLECMRPDPTNGDRTSVEAFDVHYTLKGVDKSPSIACVGIGGNLPGNRADLLIADDVESSKNSRTAAMRELLSTLTNEFPSICSNGRIIYLGTPQTSESIYITLPGKGYAVRIWPGRFPTAKELDNYGNMLAPSILRKLQEHPELGMGGGLRGDMGQPTDPTLHDEENLCSKQGQGEGYFQLNFMLNTRLTDSIRFPLKTENLVVLSGGDGKHFPTVVTRGFGKALLRSFTSSGMGFSLMEPHSISEDLAPLEGIHMQVDPAGGGANGDESAYAVTGFLNGNIFVLAIGGVPGGYSLQSLDALAQIAEKYKPNILSVEKNMGWGGFVQTWLPILRRRWHGGVEEPVAYGMKESRIIGTLEPVMGRGSLIFMEDVIQQDDTGTAGYPTGKRITYSVFHQLTHMQAVKNAVAHDDRADALEGSVRYWLDKIGVDQNKAAQAKVEAALKEFMKDPRNAHRYTSVGIRPGNFNILNRFRR